MKKRLNKKLPSIILAIVFPLSLCACGQTPSAWVTPDWIADTSQFAEEEDLVTGARYATYIIERVCVRDEGIFYVGEDNRASYYDFESGKSYYLCSNPACAHNSEDCIAYAESRSRLAAGITGLAYYGGYCYYLAPHTEDSAWDLVCVNLSEQTKTVVCVFGNDGSQENDVIIQSIQNTFYYSGRVWIEANLFFPEYQGTNFDYGYQLLAIDLADGTVIEVTSPQQCKLDCDNLVFDAYGEGKIVIQRFYDYDYENNAPLTREEFEAQDGLEQYREASEEEDALTEAKKMQAYGSYLDEYYYDSYYLSDWYVRESVLDTETMEETELYSGYYSTSGEVVAIAGGKALRFICDTSSEDESFTITRIDLSTGESEPLYVIERGVVLAWQSSLPKLYNGSGILCVQYKDVDGEKRGDICALDAYTGEMKILFEDDWRCSFRPVDQTSDKIIGKINTEMNYTWLSTEEYESGSTDYHEMFSASTFWSAYLGLG